MRDAASMDRELLELKSKLAQQEDVSAAAVGKMRRAEALATEMQKEVTAERESNTQLFKDKAALEKQIKESQLRCVDLETKSYSSGSQDVRFLHKRIKEVCPHPSGIFHYGRLLRSIVKNSWKPISKSKKTNTTPSSDLCVTWTALSRTSNLKSTDATR